MTTQAKITHRKWISSENLDFYHMRMAGFSCISCIIQLCAYHILILFIVFISSTQYAIQKYCHVLVINSVLNSFHFIVNNSIFGCFSGKDSFQEPSQFFFIETKAFKKLKLYNFVLKNICRRQGNFLFPFSSGGSFSPLIFLTLYKE